MHNKLPALTVLLLLTLTAATTFICLSGAVTPRYTEYGSGKVFSKHYIIKPAQMQRMPRGLMSVSSQHTLARIAPFSAEFVDAPPVSLNGPVGNLCGGFSIQSVFVGALLAF